MAENTSLPLSITWTAATGDHTLEVRADSQQKVVEAFEENNTQSVALPYIKDPTPPDLVSTVPANGASVKQLNTIVFTLADQYGVVDTTAVITSVAVTAASGLSVKGTVTEKNNLFTFTPDTVPLADATYTVAFTAKDLEGNTRGYGFSFTVDGQPPAEPAITGGVVLSGLIQVQPAENRSKTATIILTGTREDNTGVYVNNQKKVNLGSGNWSASLSLAQGTNSLEIRLQDAAGNHGPSVRVNITVDSKAPSITGITPANASFIKTAPAALTITFTEAISGLNLETSSLSIKDGNQQPVDGTRAVSGADKLVFTPSAAWADSLYTINVQLEDNFTNRSKAKQYSFTLDTTVPPAPVIGPVSSPTHNPAQTISGTKEAYGALLLNGNQIVGHTSQTTWSHTVNLTAGANNYSFVARDRAGNLSSEAAVEIVFDDIPPLPVDTLKLSTKGDGLTIYLDWNGYNEAAHGDVAGYRIYRSMADFTDVSAATLLATVNTGKFKYTAQNLMRATPYWFAVVAFDTQGNAHSTVTAKSGTPLDRVPPEKVRNLSVKSFSDQLEFTWEHSPDSYGDLAGYRVCFADETPCVVLTKDQGTFTKTGLSPASGYLFKVFAFDSDNNESNAAAITGATLLANPANLDAEPFSGYVNLTWQGVSPTQYVKHYAVYVSQSAFTSVEGMTPSITSTKTSGKVAGLTNHTPYFIAVTTVNISGGEDKQATPIIATPKPDDQGPEITNIQVDNNVLVDGYTLTKPAVFSCEAADPAGVSRVEFFIDGNLIRTDFNPTYTGFWNIVETTDDSHTLTIQAFDSLENMSARDYQLIVALDLPAAPVIKKPVNELLTNKTTLTVSATAEKYTEVILYNNGADTGVKIAVDAVGKFSTPLTLPEGQNRLQAAADNRAGTGPLSAEVLATVDTTLPQNPSNLTAEAKKSGVVRLTWKAPPETAVAGYNLYRASSPFTTIQGAGKINTKLITATAFDDLPPSDGTWYYRAATVDAAANESDLCAEASARADSTAPRAASLEYSPQGAFDPDSGTMAPGTVNVLLSVNEALQSDPYLSIAPDGGIPISVQLTRETDTTYGGFFVITDTTPSGDGPCHLLGRDVVGNRGTAVDAGQHDSNRHRWSGCHPPGCHSTGAHQ